MGRRWLAVGLLFALVCGLRLAYIGATSGDHRVEGMSPGLDTQLYWDASQAIATDGANFELGAASAPLYVYFLAGQRALCGDSMVAHRLLSALLSSLRWMLLFAVLLALGQQPGAAWLCIALLSTMPTVVHADSVLGKAAVDLHLLTALLYAAVWFRKRDARPWLQGAVVGALAGLIVLCQLRHLFVWAPVALYLATPGPTGWRRAFASAVVYGAFLWIAVARPLAEPGRYLPRGGIDVLIGNHAQANGAYVALPDVPPTTFGHAYEGRLAAELAAGAPLAQEQANRAYLGRARQFVTEHPGTAAALWLKKAAYFVASFELFDNESFHALAQTVPFLRWLPMSFGIWLGLCGVGALVVWRRREAWLALGIPAAVLAICLLSYVTWRFRLAALPPMAILASAGIAELGRAIGARRFRMLAVFVAVTAASYAVPAPYSFTDEHNRAAENWREAGKVRGFQRALQNSTGVQRLGLLQRLGRHTEAFALARAELARGVALPAMRAAYLQYLLWLGDYAAARATWRQIQATDPELADRLLHARRGHYGAAMARFVASQTP